MERKIYDNNFIDLILKMIFLILIIKLMIIKNNKIVKAFKFLIINKTNEKIKIYNK